MHILLFCTFALSFTLSAAFVDDLNLILSHLGCMPKNPLPLPTIDSSKSPMASELSKYCNSYMEIADCIEDNVSEVSSDPVEWNFAKSFDKAVMIRKSQNLCKKILDSDLALELNCIENEIVPSCLADWIIDLMRLREMPSSKEVTQTNLCISSTILKSCVENGQYTSCSYKASLFMAEYVSVLSGFPDSCVSGSSVSSNLFGFPEGTFNIEGSAAFKCTKEFVDNMTNLVNTNIQTDMSNIIPLVDEAFEIVCKQKDKVVKCLKNDMPDSEIALDQIILMFVNLDGLGIALDNYCSKQDVITDSIECLSRDTTVKAFMPCIDGINFNSDVMNQGFAMFDYLCSTFVNVTECYGKVTEQHCGSDVSDIITSTYISMMTPQCLVAKPRPIVGEMQTGWSFRFIPGGMVAMECMFSIMKDINDTFSSNAGDDIPSIVLNIMGKVCKAAESIIKCIETKLPGGFSQIDKLTGEIIDFGKLRAMISSTCPKREKIASHFSCFLDTSTNAAQSECMNAMSKQFTPLITNPFALILPSTREKIKTFLCGENSAFNQWVKCEAKAVRTCNCELADEVIQIMTGALSDKCFDHGIAVRVDSKCGASSIIVHSFLWLFVGAVTLRYLY